MGGLEVEEFDAHANTGLDDANGDEGFQDLALADELHAGAGVNRKRLAGANKTATKGNVRGDTVDLFAGFKID
jgi:hypothetical protein